MNHPERSQAIVEAIQELKRAGGGNLWIHDESCHFTGDSDSEPDSCTCTPTCVHIELDAQIDC